MRMRRVALVLLTCGSGISAFVGCSERSRSAPPVDASAPVTDVGDDSASRDAPAESAIGDAGSDAADAAIDAPRYGSSCVDIEAGAPPGEGFELVADSVKGFSPAQGQCGWRYGYVIPTAPTSFREMTVWDPSGPMHVIFDAGPPPWTRIGRHWQHPAVVPAEHWAVRRWVSDVAGRLAISVDAHKVDGNDGNGTVVRIAVDDVTIYLLPLARWDTPNRHFVAAASVKVGSTIAAIVEPFDGNEAWDLTVVEVRAWR